MRAAAAAAAAAALAGPAAARPRSIPPPSRFNDFLNENISPGSHMPLSYMVYPRNFFDTVPDSEKPKSHTQSEAVPQCGGDTVSAAKLNEYQFQTETYLASLGLNIYDAATWCIAKALLGDPNTARTYMGNVLLPRKTFQLADIRGDRACKGDMYTGECTDTNGTGDCGFCYGDTKSTRTQDADHAYFFRMIGDYFSLENTVDARCPDRGQQWTWNDWKPILGENAWASLLGALSTAYIAFGRNANAIPDNIPEMTLAANMVPTLMVMRAKASVGSPIYYAPRNTFFDANANAGSTVSTENQASTLAGLKGFKWILEQKGGGAHYHLLGDINTLISGIEQYMVSAWDSGSKYFRQGGTYTPSSNTWQWHQGDSPEFAVDCQTWVASVLGSGFIDSHFGPGTTLQLWETTKNLAGYKKKNGKVKGVGYTENSYDGQVFSGEWTFGAINWLRVMAAESSYTTAQKDTLEEEADYMREAVESNLLVSTPVQQGSANRASVLYANKRYFIPFGWWANPIPSLASTGWAVMVDLDWNPMMVNGAYSSSYTPGAPTPPPSPPSGGAACSAHSGCAKLGLGGNCCPTDDGTTLDCC